MTYFPTSPLVDCPANKSIPLASLIAGEPTNLVVPVYRLREQPTTAFISLSSYLNAHVGDSYVVPIASSPAEVETPQSRPVSAITATVG